MQNVLSVENMRCSDAWTIEHKTPSKELMFRAGKGVVEEGEKRGRFCGKTAIVCGSGNNAGDGYVIAFLLAEQDRSCCIVRTSEKFSEDGAFYYGKCAEQNIPVIMMAEDTDLSGFDTIVDCILGTGFQGAPRGCAAAAISAINRARGNGSYVIAVDINSGLNGDNGTASLAVVSDLTVSVGGLKSGQLLNSAADYIGELVNRDIGIEPLHRPFHLMEERDIPALFPPRRHDSNKADFGYVALIGGSLRYSGAIRLANLSNAAVRSGAGVVKLAVPGEICMGIMPHILESTLFPLSSENGDMRFSEEDFSQLLRGVKTAAFGMGIGNSPETKKAVRYLLEQFKGTLILDADGLNALAAILSEEGTGILRNASCRVILTPHLKEFSRLNGRTVQEVRENMIALAEEFAEEAGVIVLLKGPGTVITDGTETIIAARGCPGMAAGGSGDVLSGILAAVCAANGEQLLQAAAAGAFINGFAGELAQKKTNDVVMSAADTAAHVRDALIELLRDRRNS